MIDGVHGRSSYSPEKHISARLKFATEQPGSPQLLGQCFVDL